MSGSWRGVQSVTDPTSRPYRGHGAERWAGVTIRAYAVVIIFTLAAAVYICCYCFLTAVVHIC